MAKTLDEEWAEMGATWRSRGMLKRILGAFLAASVVWEFASALDFPVFQAWSAHSQVGMAIVTFMAAMWLSTVPPEERSDG